MHREWNLILLYFIEMLPRTVSIMTSTIYTAIVHIDSFIFLCQINQEMSHKSLK